MKDPANMTAEELAARIAELEAEVKALRKADTEREMQFSKTFHAMQAKHDNELAKLNEAGKVLARECFWWYRDRTDAPVSEYEKELNNPTAAAWVKEVSK